MLWFFIESKESSKVVESLILEDVDEGESRSENVMSCIARTETIHSAVNPVKLPPVWPIQIFRFLKSI